MVQVKIKKVHPDAKLPSHAHEGDAGMDVWAVSKNENEKYLEYGTGLSFELPEGYVCLIFPRSSLSNKDLILANHVGVLDSTYRGELTFRFKKTGDEVYEIGERIGQIIIIPYPKVEILEADSLEDSSRGSGGWGSTGR